MGTARKIDIDGKSYTPPEISAMILGKLKADAEAYLGTTVTEAVITVPAAETANYNGTTKEITVKIGKKQIAKPTANETAFVYTGEKQVYLLDMTRLVAGTQFRGQFESRIKGLVEEVKKIATAHTLSCDEDGVADYLEKFVL